MQGSAAAGARSAQVCGTSAVSWGALGRNIACDQRPIWSFPLKVARGQHWTPALAFVLTIAALVELDPHDAPYFRRTQSFGDFNRTFSSLHTALAEGLFPGALYLEGHFRSDTYAEKTALESGEALVDSEIVAEVIKNIARRQTPGEVSPNGDYAHTWFKAGGGFLIKRGSFLSGHTIGAFSLATVFAERYRRHHWVGWLAYGSAALIGFSRLTLQTHFPSDVFAAGVLGYSISHFVVLQPR